MKKTFFAALVITGLLAGWTCAADAPLRAGDSFELRISGVPADEMASVNSTYTIDGSGSLNLPLVGKINVSGMTPTQVQSAAERAYINGGIFTHPTITLTIAAQNRFVNVGGHVRSPQRVPYTPDMTLLSAINAAGDFDEFADLKKVTLTRKGEVKTINAKAAKNNPSLDVPVLPGDQIQVPVGFW